MKSADKIYVAGHSGMVGSAIIKTLMSNGIKNIISRRHSELDLCDGTAVENFFKTHVPDIVIIAAAKVGGIFANSNYPAEFLYDNLAITLNCVHSAYKNGTKRLLFLGSSCIYPRLAKQPICEDSLLTSSLEETNEAYAIAKISGLKLCQYYRRQYGVLYHSAMPANLYGPGDNYHASNSHVIPGLIRKFHDAKISNQNKVELWGSGKPRREFLYVSDVGEAVYHLLQIENPPDWVNVGLGTDITIYELAIMIKEIVGYNGQIICDKSKPDGTPQKLMDISKIRATGWKPKIELTEGLKLTYNSFLNELDKQTVRL